MTPMPMVMIQNAPHFEVLRTAAIGFTSTQCGHGIADHGQNHHHIGAVKRKVAVCCRDLSAVCVVVDGTQRVHETPQTRAQESNHRATHGPKQCSLVGVIETATLNHVEGKHRHHEERNGFQRAKDAANPHPVAGQADEEEMVTRAQNAGDQRHRNNDVQPFVNLATVSIYVPPKRAIVVGLLS